MWDQDQTNTIMPRKFWPILAGIWTEAVISNNIIHQVPNLRAMRNLAKLVYEARAEKGYNSSRPIPHEAMGGYIRI